MKVVWIVFGAIGTITGLVLATAPIGFKFDLFIQKYIWWADKYPLMTFIGGLVMAVVGGIVLMEALTSTGKNDATTIPPPFTHPPRTR